MESYASMLLKEIAEEEKLPLEKINKYIKTLEDNYFGTKNALNEITENDLKAMNMPLGIRRLIFRKNKTGVSKAIKKIKSVGGEKKNN